MSERLQSPLPSLTHCVPRTGVQINTAHHIHSTQLINIQSAPSHTFPSPKMAKPGNPPHALCPSVPTSNPSGKPVSSITQRDPEPHQYLPPLPPPPPRWSKPPPSLAQTTPFLSSLLTVHSPHPSQRDSCKTDTTLQLLLLSLNVKSKALTLA